MNTLGDILTYIRRIIKSPSSAQITDALLIDYVNRFWLMDVDARIQLFDLKTTYEFQTVPGVDRYNMPLYDVQTEPGSQSIAMFPVYQGFLGPAYINGIEVPFSTQRSDFFKIWPNVVQLAQVVAVGDGTDTYTIQIPFLPSTAPTNPPFNGILRGHVDMSGIIATGSNIDPPIGTALNTSIASTSIHPAFWLTSLDSTGASVVVHDSGQFLTSDVNYGLLMEPGTAPFGYNSLGSYTTTSNTINYLTGECTVTFPVAIPSGVNINAQCYFFASGLPRSILYYDNTLTLRMPPSQQYLVQLDAYLTPAAFLSTSQAAPFGYMSEYIARGAARKILSDTGDIEQFQFYEPLFKEQEMLVWKRSQRQFTSTRTQTLYSSSSGMGNVGVYPFGGV